MPWHRAYIVVLSACAVAETPFKVYEDKDKSFKQIEKHLAGKSTKWKNKATVSRTGSDGSPYTYDDYSRIYTYKDGNDNFATASFSSDPQGETRSDYQTYTLNAKIGTDDYTFSDSAGTAVTLEGYTLYQLTQLHGGSASTTQPRAIVKEYFLIKIDGDKLSAFEQQSSSGFQVDTDAKTIKFNSTGTPAPTVYNKL